MNTKLSRRCGALAALILATVLSIGFLISTSESAVAQDDPPTATRLGDADCSGTLDFDDALAVVYFVVELRDGVEQCPLNPAAEVNLAQSDIDGDGAVTITDAVLIARCARGIDVDVCAPPTRPLAANDQMVNAIEIFPNESGYEIGEGDRNVFATGEPDENRENCFRAEPSVWYKFEATSSRMSLVPTNDDQWAGIYRANDGVTNPTQMADLTLISCNDVSYDVGAIVRPGETYWVSVSDAWRQNLWAFDREPGCPNGELARCAQRHSNDRFRQAIGIDLVSEAPVLVDDFSPGFNDYTSTTITWSYERNEIGRLGCTDSFPVNEDTLNDPTTGSIWYQVVATGDTLEISGGENQQVAIFLPNKPHIHWRATEITSIDDLTRVACGESSSKPATATSPGQTYFVAAFGPNPGEPFTITAGAEPTQAANDQMINATEIFPNSDGFSIGAVSYNVNATTEPDETRDNCITQRFGEGTVWYKFEAATSRVSFLPSGDEQFISIFRPSAGVTSPTQMSDLELISCGEADLDVGAIVRPGETYWVAVSGSWRQRLWVFDRDPGCPAEFAQPCQQQRRSNDLLRQAIGIDVRNDGTPTDVDDFDPGWSTEQSSSITWSYSRDEVGNLGCGAAANVSSADFQGASFWYQVVAPSELLEIRGSDDQYVGIYKRNEPHLPGPFRLSDLTQVACGQPGFRPAAATVPGETYFVVSWEEYPGQVFSISAQERAENDDIINAIEIAAAPDGALSSPDGSGRRGTLSAGEDASNCHDESGPNSEGSVWYRFTATSARVSVVGGETANSLVGIYVPQPGVLNPTDISDLVVLSCSRLGKGASAIVIPGAAYWVSVGQASDAFWLFDGAPQCAQALDIVTACPVRSNDFVNKATGIDMTSSGGRFVDDFTPTNNAPGTYGMQVTFDDAELAAMEVDGSCFTASDDYETGSIWYRLVAPANSLTADHIDQQTIALYEVAAPESSPAAESAVSDLSDLRLVGCSLEPFGTPSSAATTPGATYYLAVSGPLPGQTFDLHWPH